MTDSRASQVDPSVTAYYHCISRCVRRAYLCGNDPVTGRSFEHRKTWLVERIHLVASVFAVDLCSYTIMDNHYHLLLRMAWARAAGWSEEEVLRRYGVLFPKSVANVGVWPPQERSRRINIFRARLADISWIMRSLNEWLARKANREDGVKGRFWEGRFKSQALLDERALVTCMAYVDLNPVRAGIATTLEGSEFTSIEQRLREVATHRALRPRKGKKVRSAPGSVLAPFLDQVPIEDAPNALPILFSDYLELLDWTGRRLHPTKRGRITGPPPAALRTAKIDSERWHETMQTYHRRFFNVVGSCEQLERHAARTGKGWLRGKLWAQQLFVAA